MDVQFAQIARKVTKLEVVDLQRIQCHKAAGILMDQKDVLVLYVPTLDQIASSERNGTEQALFTEAGVTFQTLMLGLGKLKDRTDLGTVEVVTSNPKVFRALQLNQEWRNRPLITPVAPGHEMPIPEGFPPDRQLFSFVQQLRLITTAYAVSSQDIEPIFGSPRSLSVFVAAAEAIISGTAPVEPSGDSAACDMVTSVRRTAGDIAMLMNKVGDGKAYMKWMTLAILYRPAFLSAVEIEKQNACVPLSLGKELGIRPIPREDIAKEAYYFAGEVRMMKEAEQEARARAYEEAHPRVVATPAPTPTVRRAEEDRLPPPIPDEQVVILKRQLKALEYTDDYLPLYHMLWFDEYVVKRQTKEASKERERLEREAFKEGAKERKRLARQVKRQKTKAKKAEALKLKALGAKITA